MDTDVGKLFIGGISWETSEEKLKDYFGNYGEVLQTVIMRDKITGRPRGFGFVAFADPDVLDRVLQDKHTIDGRTVEAKRALSRDEQHTSSRTGNSNSGRSFGGGGGGGGGGSVRTKKIFVGGLPPTLSEEGFRSYFEQYGGVTDVVVMYDQSTQRPRGFGFISFDSEDAVDRVLHKSFHELNGKMVEVKRALPKDANPGNGGGRSAGGVSGGYQGYNSSGMNAGSYDGRMDANRYMQPTAPGGGFPTYGSAGYGAPNYGYGSANNGSVGYGGYGVGGYGGAPGAGYTAPTGGYGNPAAGGAGYVSGPPGAPRSPWNNQAPSGYGIQGAAAGYGANTGYGAGAAWSAPGVGGAAAGGGGSGMGPTGQSPTAAAGYGNQGYGYGYGGNEGAYANQSGYGAVGGRASSVPSNNAGGGGEQTGANAGYMGSGYGDANGNSGYPNAVWRSDPSQGGGYGTSQANGTPQVGYGGGYGGQTRQAQQQ